MTLNPGEWLTACKIIMKWNTFHLEIWMNEGKIRTFIICPILTFEMRFFHHNDAFDLLTTKHKKSSLNCLPNEISWIIQQHHIKYGSNNEKKNEN